MKKALPPILLGLSYASALYGMYLSPLQATVPSISFIALALLFAWLAIYQGQKQEKEGEKNS